MIRLKDRKEKRSLEEQGLSSLALKKILNFKQCDKQYLPKDCTSLSIWSKSLVWPYRPSDPCKAHQDLSNFKTWFVASLLIKSETKDNPFKTKSVSEILSSRLFCKILKPPRTLKFSTQFAFPRVKAENAKISRLIVLQRKRGKNK